MHAQEACPFELTIVEFAIIQVFAEVKDLHADKIALEANADHHWEVAHLVLKCVLNFSETTLKASQSSWNFVCFYMNPKRLGACLEQRNTATIKCKMKR